ncbi:MAG: imidazolonepropionase [Bacteriovoracia bacterium]
MKVYRHLSQIVTLDSALKKDGRRLSPDDLSVISDGAIAFDNNEILWVGNSVDLPAPFLKGEIIDLPGHVLTPGLVDSHTHLLFGGNRAREYSQRLNGVDYQAIAKSGGGILYTMNETLKLSEDQLFEIGTERVIRLESYGIKTIEMKSGYALTQEGELRLLRTAKRLKEYFAGRVRIFSTYLGAHAVPAGFKSSATFIDEVVIPTLKIACNEQLVDGVDIFAEQGYFSAQDVEKLFECAKALSLPTKIHADEFNDNGGASLAARHQSLSADHLLKISDKGISDLANSMTVATLLPGTAFFLGKPLAPARTMLDAGCKVALASDYNPGSSHVDNLLLVASLAAPSLKLNQAELWAAITLNASAALGFFDQGAIAVGKKPTFALFRVTDISEVTYSWGRNLSVICP